MPNGIVNASALAALLALAFAAVVGRRWARTRRPAFAAWAAGLLIFAIAAASQAIGLRDGFSPAVFRVFYLFGGVLGVIYLAQGTVYLMAPRRLAHASAVVLAVVTVVVAADAVVIPVDSAKLGTAAGVLGEAITGHGNPLYIGAVVCNILGTVILVGGSGWSAFRLWRDRAGLDRVVCNVLLTSGALVIAFGFSAAKTVGGGRDAVDSLGVYEAVGIAVMFAGFLSLGRIRRGATSAATLLSGRPVGASHVREPVRR
jgi:hypothetical protein